VLYVCNKGANSLSVYSIDPNTGALTQAAASPVSPGLTAPSSVAFDSTSTAPVFYLTGTAAGAGSVEGFRIGATPSALTSINQLGTANGPEGGLISQVFVDPNPNPIPEYLVANSAADSISLFKIDATTGALTVVQNAIPTGKTPISLEHHSFIDPATAVFDTFFVANSGDGTITSFVMNATSGNVAQQSVTTVGPGLHSLVNTGVDVNGFLYATATQGVYGFSYQLDGSLAPLQTDPATGQILISAAVKNPGVMGLLYNTLYVVSQTDEDLSIFTLENDGTLFPVAAPAAVTTGHGPTSIALIVRPYFGP